MDQSQKVIFAELKRDAFESIVVVLKQTFTDLQYGSQGDDWIWIQRKGMKIEIDSFYSSELEVKGSRRAYGLVMEILRSLEDEWIIETFPSPKVDLTE